MKKYRIVIVEDDADERLFMKEGFDAVGLFEILTQAKNGDEFIEWLSQPREILPDFILTDLNMPGKNGFDILDYIRAHPTYSSIPVIVLTTGNTKFMINKSIAKGLPFL